MASESDTDAAKSQTNWLDLFKAGFQYPFSNSNWTQILFGGYLLTSIIGILPVLGFLVKITEETISNSIHQNSSFPSLTHLRAWVQLSKDGLKTIVIIIVFLFAPVDIISRFATGPVEALLQEQLEVIVGRNLLVLGAGILLLLYPAVVGNFVPDRQTLRSINAVSTVPVFSDEYIRGTFVTLMFLAGGLLVIRVLWEQLGGIALVLIGPVLFYTLFAIHSVIGLTWNEIHLLDSRTEEPPPKREPFWDRLSPARHQSQTHRQVDRALSNGDRHEITRWEPRSGLDSVAEAISNSIQEHPRKWAFGLLAVYFVINFAHVVIIMEEIAGLTLIMLGSIASSIVIVSVIWLLCSRPQLPFQSVGVTFVLGFAFAPLYTTIGYAFNPPRGLLAIYIYEWFAFSLFLILIPLSAVLVSAYRRGEFTTVLDGVVYLAIATAGTNLFVSLVDIIFIYDLPSFVFGTLSWNREDAVYAVILYIPTNFVITMLAAIVGYYVGLAAFNRQQQGPIITKGLLFIFLLGIPYPFIQRAYWVHLGTERPWVEYLPGVVNRKIISGFQPIADIASAWLGVQVPYYEAFAFVIEIGYVLVLVLILVKILFPYRHELRQIQQEETRPNPQTVDSLKALEQLYRAGAITEAEFEKIRTRIEKDELAYREAGLGTRLWWWLFGRRRGKD